MSAREIAFSVLMEHERGGGEVSGLLHGAFSRLPLPAAERGLATELVYGCVRRRLTLRWLIRKYARFRLPPPVGIVLELGLYQLLYLDRVPDYAAVSEAVEMAAGIEKGKWKSPVNAILRRAQSERKGLPWPSKSRSLQRFLSVRYSHPAWFVGALMREHGPAAAEEILKSNNRRPKLTIRCNTLRARPRTLKERLEKEGVDVRAAAGSPIYFHVTSETPLAALESFRNGLFTVQDVSSGLAAEMLRPRPGESILDLCAGPGGKTTYLAQMMGDEGEVYAVDSSVEKARMIRESCERMRVRSVRCTVGDARGARAILGGRLFDRVLVDAPCSNTGVWSRRVEARWRMGPAAVRALSALQYSLLEAAAGCLKEDGAIVYSTCSILEEENAAVARRGAGDFGLRFSHDLLKLQGMRSGGGAYCALLRPKK